MEKARPIISFDWAIKTVLRDKANADVLEGFLSALMGQNVRVLELLESESNRQDGQDKYNRVDLMAKIGREDEVGEQVIFEIQFQAEVAFFHRLLYSVSKAISENLHSGDRYEKVKKFYCISLLYFQLEQGNADYIYHGKTLFTGIHSKKAMQPRQYLLGPSSLPSALENGDIFPEYFLIPLPAFSGEVKNRLDQWIYSFKNSEVRTEFDAPKIGALREKLDIYKMSATEREAYDRYIDNKRSALDQWDFAEKEGIEKGRKEGRVALLATARNLLRLNLSVAQVAQATNLSEEEIRNVT